MATQRHLLPIHIARLVVERHESRLGDILAIVLHDPVRKHVCAGKGSTGGPEFTVDDPLLLPRPLDLRTELLSEWHRAVVGCRTEAVEHPREAGHHGAGAGREQDLDLWDPLTYELEIPLIHVRQHGRIGPADKEVVEFWAVLDAGGWIDAVARCVNLWLHCQADVMEFDLDAAFGKSGRGADGLHTFQIWLGGCRENIERTDDIHELVRQLQHAELNRCHTVLYESEVIASTRNSWDAGDDEELATGSETNVLERSVSYKQRV